MASGLSFEISTELFHLTKDIIRIDSLGWELHGDITSHDYQIIDEATHTILATVHRKFFSLHDVYEIEINDEQQRDVLMAAIIVLEHIHSQRDAARVGAAAVPAQRQWLPAMPKKTIDLSAQSGNLPAA